LIQLDVGENPVTVVVVIMSDAPMKHMAMGNKILVMVMMMIYEYITIEYRALFRPMLSSSSSLEILRELKENRR